MQPVSPSDMKSMNRRLIFEMFRNNGVLTRVELSHLTNLSLPSVNKLVQELLDSGILLTRGEINTRMGRKPLELEFNLDAIRAFGVDFEGGELTVGLTRLDGSIVEQVTYRDVKRLDAHCMDRISETICRMMRGNGGTGKIAGIGLGIPGVVGPEAGRIRFAPLVDIRGDQDVSHILNRLEEETALPVFVENDVNAAAVGELLVRRDKKIKDLVYISMGTGLGAGIILGGRLRRGAHRQCGELGYYTQDKVPVTVRDSAGWLETRINLDAMNERFDGELEQPARAAEISAYISRFLAPAVANLVNILDVEAVVIGGVLAKKLGDTFIRTLSADLAGMTLSDIPVEGNRSRSPGIVGAASLVIEQRLDQLV